MEGKHEKEEVFYADIAARELTLRNCTPCARSTFFREMYYARLVDAWLDDSRRTMTINSGT